MSNYCKECYERQEQIEQLKAECEMLKKANFTLRERTINYSEYKERQYKQALEDIRDIADENKDTAQYRGICLSILTKINEVIGVE